MKSSADNLEKKRKRVRLNRKITRVLDIPMALLSLVFLLLFVGSLSVSHDSHYRLWFDRGITGIWILFILEFCLKFLIAPRRLDFLRRHWFDLFIIVIPFLRTLRAFFTLKGLRSVGLIFRTVSAGRGVSAFRVLLVMSRAMRNFREFMRISRFAYVAIITVSVVFCSAGAVLWFERAEVKANIRTFGDALWWSATVVTTVACDLNPVSPGGRILGVSLMIYGVTVFGYFVSYAVMFIQGQANVKKK